MTALNDLQHRSRSTFEKAGSAYTWMGWIMGVPAMTTLLGGFISLRGKDPNFVGIFIGVFLLALAAVLIISGRRFRSR